MKEHTHIEHIVTHSETDALLLEAQLIREHKPKFNVLFKSGQPFVYLLFTQEELPRFELVLAIKSQKGTYFGPFLHKGKVRRAHAYLMRSFQLSLCKLKFKMDVSISMSGNCAGNCLANFDEEAYVFRLFLAQNLLEGHYAASLKIG